MTITGTHTYTDEEEGNTVTGDYVRTKNGADVYEIEVTGTKTNGAYSQTVSGAETYTLVDAGNLATGHYDRTIQGDGTYSRTSTGAGAEMPTDAGAIDYLWEQAGDPQSGVFDLIQTGTHRYDLLEDFYDISNTQPDKSPGHMNWYPAGQTFVDPGPDRIDIAPRTGYNSRDRWILATPEPQVAPRLELPRFAPQLGLEGAYVPSHVPATGYPAIGGITENEIERNRRRMLTIELNYLIGQWRNGQPLGAAWAPGWSPSQPAPRPPGYPRR